MQSRRRTSVIVVGGALAIASVGYGLGTQADDGTAAARGGQSTEGGERAGGGPGLLFERGHPPGFGDLADKLGVDADKLEEAMHDFREQEGAARRDGFATDLAKALGIPAAKVEAAFEQMHKRHEARFAARLAKSLGVDADRVQAALDKLVKDRPIAFDSFAQQLATELDLEAADVRKALMESGPGRGHRDRARGDGPHVRHALPLRQLASALDVSRAELRKAFRELSAGAEKRFEERDQALAEFLAERFDLDVDKVSDALGELPRPAPHGHGGRPGPGGPGAFGAPR